MVKHRDKHRMQQSKYNVTNMIIIKYYVTNITNVHNCIILVVKKQDQNMYTYINITESRPNYVITLYTHIP
jgi:hypothetical protein